MKTYHMYHTESISAEGKLKEAEKQEEKQFSKSGDISISALRHEDRPQRRSSVRKMEKMKEKVSVRGFPFPPSAYRGVTSDFSGSVCVQRRFEILRFEDTAVNGLRADTAF